MSKFQTLIAKEWINLTNEVLREKYNWVGTVNDLSKVGGKRFGVFPGNDGSVFDGDFCIGNLQFSGQVAPYQTSLVLYKGTKMIYLKGVSNLSEQEGEKKSMSIKESQKTLKRLGYDPGIIDGKFGKKTEEAIKAFQKDNKLEVTGKLDEETKKSLFQK